MVKEAIETTEKEELIFTRLLHVCEHFNLETKLRVAGGWVRDKLLGKESSDIDFALDDMSGREFAGRVQEYYMKLSTEKDKEDEFRGMCVIPCNPDQSKHLETARIRLFDQWIDLVNLRAEDYSETSRIPITTSIGTPEQDADRRDLTINSLFYNIHTRSIEDLTKKGLEDLKSGKIRTPLSPKQTFLDDPLRVLRAIRFGARFGFVLDEELKTAAADSDIRAALSVKISKERIGHEIDLMMYGNHPAQAMAYITELQLFRAVFSLPPETEPSTLEGCERSSIAYMDSTWRFLQLIGPSSFTDDQRRLCLYASLFLPLKNAVYKAKKGKKVPVVKHIFCNSLKLKNSDAEIVISMHLAVQKFISLIPSIISKENLQILEVDWKTETIDVPIASKLRILSGLFLREVKDFWRAALVLSLILHPHDICSSITLSNTELNERKELFIRVENAILEMGLENIWELKPVVDGNEIKSVLELESGSVVKEWQRKVLQWQLANPSGSAKECKDWMRENQRKHARTE